MTTLGIIAARKGSLRFPHKHHAMLLGKPMFAYTLEAAAKATLLDRLVVSSDDMELKTLADQYGVAFLPRPAELATSTAALDDTLRHVWRHLALAEGFEADVVISLQGNVPIRKDGQIDDVVRRLHDTPDATAVCTAQEVRLRPEWAKRMKDTASGEVVPYLPGYTAYRTQDYDRLFMLDGAICGVRAETLFDQEGHKVLHAWLGQRLHIVVQDHPMYSLEIDYPDEVSMAAFYLLCQRYGEAWYEKLLDGRE